MPRTLTRYARMPCAVSVSFTVGEMRLGGAAIADPELVTGEAPDGEEDIYSEGADQARARKPPRSQTGDPGAKLLSY